ncbi:T9SS type A sorting domain-containing protein [Flavobacterium sp.]|uniref:T9SS type A sorting domain-containing protein n=1 Tax=Flavobacterium sp. TaxID=239 RepID=UPI002FDCBCD2
MKKLLLVWALFLATSLMMAQNFNQPTQFNNVCDDNNDGIASFWLDEISAEIMGNNNPQQFLITHHETQLNAQTGANPLTSPYFNISPNTQTIFVRIVTVATQEVQYLTYQLQVNEAPDAPTYTVTNCADVTTSFPCWNIAVVTPGPTQIVSYFATEFDAMAQVNEILNPTCYISQFASPNQPPVFYRIEDPLTGCFAIGVIELATIQCENPNCTAPTQITVSNLAQTSAVIGWTSQGTETSWSIAISSNGGPTTSLFTNVNPYVLTGLSCGANYFFSVTANCDAFGTSVPSDWLGFVTMPCSPQPGQPINLTQCGDNAFACFDLTQNDAYIMGNLNPAEYTITYHQTQADAENGVAAIVNESNFCAQHGQVIYARLQNNATGEYQIFGFALVVEAFTNNVTPLNNIQQCDENNDGMVTFDLTTVQAQLNTSNPIQYYPSLSNAQNQVVPFTNPAALNLSVQNPIVTVFVRETVPNDCDNIYSFQLQVFANCNVAYTCSQANSLCSSLGVPFANTVNLGNSGTSGCLSTTPNSTWFYLPVSNAGTINLQISQVSNQSGNQIDVDYIVYGPFTDPVTPCANQSQLLSNIVSCSYSTSAIEFPVIPNALPGQFYLLMVTNFSNQPGLITIIQTNQGGGSGSGAIDCTGLRLNAFLDTNNNGTQDSGEQNFPLGQFTYEINSNGNVHNVVSPTGVYNIYDTNASNSYQLSYTIDPNYASSYAVSTASYSNVHVVVGAGMQTYNFPVTVTQNYNDLAVAIVPINAPRPGFTYQNKVVYTNLGNQTIASGTVSFTKDPVVTITNNTQSGTTPTANGFTYNFANLLPFETREMTVTMQVPVIPTVSIGQLLTHSATIVPLVGDVVPTNNAASNSQIIIGAYDPNDKMEAHGERILHSSFTSNDFLTYTIRFENTGTANAIDVRVNDVLSADLDESTIRMVSASHPYVMDRVGNNVNWIFENIQLPPSVANTNIGKGYITFQIKPRAGYAVGDIIPNTASIYFDFNPPIITNTFNTEFVQQLGVDEFESADFVFYPNPVSDIVTITVKNNSAISSVTVYDVLGKMILSQKPTAALPTQTIDFSAVSKGIYLLEVTTESGLKAVKKLIVE